MHRPSASTTGIRLIWCCCMACSQRSRFSPSRQVTSSALMYCSIVVLLGSLPSATAEQQMSRSVIMPMSCCDCWSATTGSAPTSSSRSICATLWIVSVAIQQTGFGVIASRTFIETSTSNKDISLTCSCCFKPWPHAIMPPGSTFWRRCPSTLPAPKCGLSWLHIAH